MYSFGGENRIEKINKPIQKCQEQWRNVPKELFFDRGGGVLRELKVHQSVTKKFKKKSIGIFYKRKIKIPMIPKN